MSTACVPAARAAAAAATLPLLAWCRGSVASKQRREVNVYCGKFTQLCSSAPYGERCQPPTHAPAPTWLLQVARGHPSRDGRPLHALWRRRLVMQPGILQSRATC